MTSKEQSDFEKCMEANKHYNAKGLNIIAEAYLMRSETIVNTRK